MKFFGLWFLPLVVALKRRTEALPEGSVSLALGNAAAPSHELPEKFVKLNKKVLNATKLQYLRCDPNLPPQNTGDRCRAGTVDLHFTPRPLKLVLGVMAMTSQGSIHEAHRSTWMKKPGVCSVDRYNDRRCKVFPMFVFGDTGAARANAHDAVTLDDVPEPPQIWDGFADTKNSEGWKRSWWTSQFKTPAWLAFASKEYSWATHIGKMDSDTFPDITSIMEDLASEPVSGGGHVWPIMYGRRFPGGYNGKGGMFGEFYALSRSLIPCFLQEDAKKKARSAMINGRNTTWGDEWWDHAEDQVLRTTLFHAEEAHLCPAMLDVATKRWEHPV